MSIKRMFLKKFFRNFFNLIKKSRKHQVILAAALFLLGGVIFLFIFLRDGLFLKGYIQKPSDERPEGKQDYSLPAGVRTIDGVKVSEEEANRRPQAVMIENIVTVRPQSGLGAASLVYEALAEGGIPRFLVFYSGAELEEIGPVRSARIYYLDWARELDAVYVYCGGDPYALRKIKEYNIRDLDQMYNGHFFWRTSATIAPHNLFTKTELLDKARAAKGWEDKGEFEPWLFKEEKALEERPEGVKDVVINFSTYSYQVIWRYDRENNVYQRWNGGVSHLDKNTGEQITAKNVVIQYTVARLKDSGALEGRLGMHTIGGDRALVFQDGEVISGIWKKPSQEARTRFYNEKGEEIKFNPGPTWIEVVPPEKEVKY